jgi:hypothetical protein
MDNECSRQGWSKNAYFEGFYRLQTCAVPIPVATGVDSDISARRGEIVLQSIPRRLRPDAQSRGTGQFSEADSTGVTQPRGRPAVFSEETLRRASGYSYARRVGTRRGAQDLVYRMFAIAVIEHYCEAFPESAQAFDWLLRPRRHSLLSELGRVAQPRSGDHGDLRWNERDVALLIQTALEVANSRPSTKAGVTMIRDQRKRIH